ncbi:MAG TPA: amino acid adenylation domain-containing protein [Longimicrobiaceae bacterium]|nr:amino acid adenylation domain-containing protein [Longimicrobiaceae bacterium]
MKHGLSDLFRRSASAHAGRMAALDPARGEAATYAELAAAAVAFANALHAAGVQPGDRVGLHAPKSIGALAAILGTLEAGAAYVPVDASAPLERGAYILRDCGVRALVTPGEGGETMATEVFDASRPDPAASRALAAWGGGLALHVPDPAPPSVPGPDGLSYVLYTSGSTGRPKGVMHTHDSALAFVDWCSDAFDPTPEDRFSSHAPFHFDLSILDLYVPLKHGAAVVLVDEEIGKSPRALAPVLSETGITVWYSTPTILRLLVEFGELEEHPTPDLRLVLFAGEVFPIRQLRALMEARPGPDYWNLYGPTETNVCTAFRIPAEIPPERAEPYPIGGPVSGDRAGVRDPEGRVAAVGEEGELWVAGPSVMLGYWNLPERTAEAFVEEAGVRWYRTGDVVRETGDGFEFLGRRDRMVKRRGYRVELGEIETALFAHDQVLEAAVVAGADGDGGVMITAFVSGAAGWKPSILEMKRYCAERLPGYMIPDRFRFVDDLPKTSTDKVDYRSLAERA